MIEFPFMPIAVDTLIAGNAHMSAEQFGAYMRLVVALWRAGGEMDADDVQLARIVGLPINKWKKIAPIVTSGMRKAGNRLHDPGVLEVIRKTRERSQKAKKAANVKWDNHRTRPKQLNYLGAANADAPSEHVLTRRNQNQNQNQNHNQNLSLSDEAMQSIRCKQKPN